MLIVMISLGLMFNGILPIQHAEINTSASNKSLQKDSVVEKEAASIKSGFGRKGRAFFYWGYNRSAYSKSNIHFWGDGYDFTIYDVAARDSPTRTFVTYIKPTSFSVPQYNYRIGYYLNDRYSVSIGNDHMKYHLKKQATHLTGKIAKGIPNAGTYNDSIVAVGEEAEEGGTEDVDLSDLPREFVPEYEHCDGLNDLTAELGRTDNLWVAGSRKHALSAIGTVGFGLVATDTEAEVLGIHDRSHTIGGWGYHLAGFSTTASIGLQFDFCKHFFLLTRVKGGYINLMDITTTMYGGKASQKFGFIEHVAVFGFAHSF